MLLLMDGLATKPLCAYRADADIFIADPNFPHRLVRYSEKRIWRYLWGKTGLLDCAKTEQRPRNTAGI